MIRMAAATNTPEQAVAAAYQAMAQFDLDGAIVNFSAAVGGLALGQAGRHDEGMAMLDEGMALICGSAEQSEPHQAAVCSFFTACYYTADLERFEAWSPLLRQRGLVGDLPGGQAILSSH